MKQINTKTSSVNCRAKGKKIIVDIIGPKKGKR